VKDDDFYIKYIYSHYTGTDRERKISTISWRADSGPHVLCTPLGLNPMHILLYPRGWTAEKIMLTGKNVDRIIQGVCLRRLTFNITQKILGVGKLISPQVCNACSDPCKFDLKMFVVTYSFHCHKVIADYANYEVIRGHKVTCKSDNTNNNSAKTGRSTKNK